VEKRLHREEAVSRKRHSNISKNQNFRALLNLTYWQPAPNVKSGHGFIVCAVYTELQNMHMRLGSIGLLQATHMRAPH
jgi:hypothetical protein